MPFVLAVCLSVRTAAAAASSAPEDLEQARRVLAAAAHAYQAAPAMTDTFTYVVKGPNMDREPKKIRLRMGAGKDASLADALLAATAVGDRFYLTKSDAPSAYVARPFAGDFGETLAEVAGRQSSLFEPVQIALRSGKSPEACIDALRFNLLGPLHVTGFERVAGNDGRTMDVIRLEADNGREEVRLDPGTHFVASVQLRVQPSGAPSGVSVEIRGAFAPRILSRAAGVVAFDPGDRRAVSELAELTSETLPVGKPAPAFDLETPAGKRIALADLKGRAVVLDFWATWCVPCWKTLKETQRLADWAASSGTPVTVLAVNTMERFPSDGERRDKVALFLKSQGLTFTTLLDRESSLFRSFGSPGLPSLVVVGPEGTILEYHQGLLPNLVETVQAEVTKALDGNRPAGGGR